MKTKKLYLIGFFVLFVSLVFTACDTFFSTSWGKERDYDPAKINLNVDNLDDWLYASVGRPKLAAAVNVKIKELVNGLPPGHPDRLKLQKAGVRLAIEASGVGTSLLSNVDKLVDAAENGDADALKNILDSILDDFRDSGGPAAANDLAEIIDQHFIDNASQTERDMAAVVLALAILGSQNITNFEDITLENLGLENNNGVIEIHNDTIDPIKVNLLLELLNKSAGNSDSLAGSFFDL